MAGEPTRVSCPSEKHQQKQIFSARGFHSTFADGIFTQPPLLPPSSITRTSLERGLLRKHKPWRKETFPSSVPSAQPHRAVPEPVHRSRAQHLAGSCGSLLGTYPAAAALARACREQRGRGRHSCGQSWAQTQGRGSATTSSERRGRKLFLGQELFWGCSILLSQPG